MEMMKRKKLLGLVAVTFTVVLILWLATRFYPRKHAAKPVLKGAELSQTLPKLNGPVEEPEPVLAEHSGSVRIVSEPDGANIQVHHGDQTEELTTPAEIKDLRFTGSETELAVKISKAGYIAEERYFLILEEKPDAEIKIAMVAAANGLLNVQAIPWGQVGVDQKDHLKETPLIGQSLKPGSHTIFVHQPGTNKSVQTTISVAPSQQLLCVANFSGEPVLNCR